MDNPREFNNLGTMAFFHKRYRLGDNHNLSLSQAIDIEHNKNFISIPVYMYDHSGFTLSVTPFNCPWDSGKLGIIFVQSKKALIYFNRKKLSHKLIDRIKHSLYLEVINYNNYLQN